MFLREQITMLITQGSKFPFSKSCLVVIISSNMVLGKNWVAKIKKKIPHKICWSPICDFFLVTIMAQPGVLVFLNKR